MPPSDDLSIRHEPPVPPPSTTSQKDQPKAFEQALDQAKQAAEELDEDLGLSEREERLLKTVGVPPEDYDKAVKVWDRQHNPEGRTPDLIVPPTGGWPYNAGPDIIKVTPDTHGGVGLFQAVNEAAHLGVQKGGEVIKTEVNIGDMTDKSCEAYDAKNPSAPHYRANVGDTLKSVLYLPETYGVNLITVPGNHEDGIRALTAPHLAKSLDGFADKQVQTLRTGGPEDQILLAIHALVVMSRARYAGKTFPEMKVDISSEMAALQPHVKKVGDKNGWVDPPINLALELYQSLQTKVLAGLEKFDPKVLSYFTNKLPSYVQVGDYLLVHAGVRPHVPLGTQTPYDPMWIRLPFTKSFPDYGGAVVAGHNIHAYPTVHLGVDRAAPQDWQRVFGAGAPAVPGGGTFTGARFQIDTGTGATHWDQHTQLILGPDDRVRFAIKPKGEDRVLFLDMKDAVDQGYVKMQLHERNRGSPAA